MINLQDLKNKTVIVKALDFVGTEKPSRGELESKGLFGGEFEWSESNNSWVLIRPTKGRLLESPENESLMRGCNDKALWFFSFPGQFVAYKIRITQESVDRGIAQEEMAAFPNSRKVNWNN
jgi:hypothetical protein